MTRIAFTTDDGETISSHFGQAHYFRVITIEENQAISSELREKPWHQHGQGHEMGPGVHPGQAMVDLIRDCQVLITGGMGEPALNRAQAAGLEVFLTPEMQIESALEKYRNGKLASDLKRIHHH